VAVGTRWEYRMKVQGMSTTREEYNRVLNGRYNADVEF
jgi:hypothetical protein